MPINKQALIRYHALDRCFGNHGRKYYIHDLVETCNQSLAEAIGENVSVQKRQIYADIRFMESEDGYAIELERFKDGRKVYFRYFDPVFSIRNQPINEAEKAQLQETLDLLGRFGGMPQFEWIEELKVRLASQEKEAEGKSVTVFFEQNPYLTGTSYFWPLFQAVQHQRVLKVVYQGFRQPEPVNIFFHPYFLKEYNSRWFVFGWNQEQAFVANLPLDRIQNLEETDRTFIPNSTIDPVTYFEDLIGVSRRLEDVPEFIILRVETSLWPYLQTKPLHGSQKVINRVDDYIDIQLALIPNFEFKSLLLSYGDELEVIAPERLRQEIRDKVLKMKSKYI